MNEKKVNIPQKGSAQRLQKRLEELGRQRAPQTLIDKINQTENDGKKVAAPAEPSKEAGP